MIDSFMMHYKCHMHGGTEWGTRSRSRGVRETRDLFRENTSRNTEQHAGLTSMTGVGKHTVART